MTRLGYKWIIIVTICGMLSCHKIKDVNSYIAEYQSLEDSISASQKQARPLESDSIRVIKKNRFASIAEGLKMLDDNTLHTNDFINKELLILKLENERIPDRNSL